MTTIDDNVEVQIALTPERALYLPQQTDIQGWVNGVLKTLDKSGSICVRIVERMESEALNLQYRGRPRPTNVLSFPAEQPAGIPDTVETSLGDIAVCASIVDEEARQQNKDPASHWAHMIVHGVLHLLGYDHQNHREADVMEALEVKILEGFGISNPYDY